MWIQKAYKSFSGFKWVWVSEENKEFSLDETCFNKPKCYTTEYAEKNHKRISARQYKNGLSAICLKSPNGNKAIIIKQRVETITLKTKAEFLRSCNIDTKTAIKVDYRNLGLKKFGFNVVLAKKHQQPIERLFGYKTAIHQLPTNTPQEITEAIHRKYLSKLFEIIN